MFAVATEPSGLITVTLGGQIDGAEMEAGLTHLFAEIGEREGLRILHRLDDIALPTLAALAVELRHMPNLMRVLGRIDRVAVLSEQPFVRTGAEAQGMLMPGIEIRAWRHGAEAEARAWLAS